MCFDMRIWKTPLLRFGLGPSMVDGLVLDNWSRADNDA